MLTPGKQDRQDRKHQPAAPDAGGEGGADTGLRFHLAGTDRTTALAVFASPALAIQSVQKFSANVSPSKAGTKQRPKAISLQANPYFDTNAPDLDREVRRFIDEAHATALDILTTHQIGRASCRERVSSPV